MEINDSDGVSVLAVDEQVGGRGVGHSLLSYAEEEGKSKGLETLSLYTVSCQVSSIQLYLKFGMMIQKVITVSEEVPFPYILYFEKNSELEKKRNYLESIAYEEFSFFESV